MSRETFTLAYDGPALQDGAMDVRDLAPSLMAIGQLLDAANVNLNGETAHLRLQVTATGEGSFEISFELIQNWATEVLKFFAAEEMSGAANLLRLVLGVGTIGATCIVWLTKTLRGRSPDKVEKLSDSMMRITFEGQSYDIPLELLRLYKDLAVRTAAQRLIEEPLRRDGIDLFEVRKGGVILQSVTKSEAVYFARPMLPDETLVDETRRSAFSIVALAFTHQSVI